MKRPILQFVGTKSLVFMLLLGGTVAISFRQQVDSPKRYPFVYPASFGNNYMVPSSNVTTEEGVQLGRMLFYETRLSANNTISCANCHKQEYAFADNRRQSVGHDGSLTTRNAMALVNLLWVKQFFWDGRVKGLEEQAVFPLTDPHEMGQALEESVEKLQQTAEYPTLFKAAFGTDVTAKGIVRALAQFERTLISASSRYDRFLNGEYLPDSSEKRGMDLFTTANCAHCHGGPKMYKELFHNNGFDISRIDPGRSAFTGRQEDKGRFRVATLRNIALTSPYMHDGRFATLREVLDHYSDHIQPSETLSPFLTDHDGNSRLLRLTSQEKTDIIAFLQLLTDSTFITNPLFSNPFNVN